jgi:hypothetical protein
MFCEYADRVSIKDTLVCTVDRIPCGYVIWCITDRCTKNRADFIKCSKRNGVDKMIKKNVEPEVIEVFEEVEAEVERDEEVKDAICQVAFSHKDYVYFTFENETLREFLPLFPQNQTSIQIEYTGTYGQPDFKVIRIR